MESAAPNEQKDVKDNDKADGDKSPSPPPAKVLKMGNESSADKNSDHSTSESSDSESDDSSDISYVPDSGSGKRMSSDDSSSRSSEYRTNRGYCKDNGSDSSSDDDRSVVLESDLDNSDGDTAAAAEIERIMCENMEVERFDSGDRNTKAKCASGHGSVLRDEGDTGKPSNDPKPEPEAKSAKQSDDSYVKMVEEHVGQQVSPLASAEMPDSSKAAGQTTPYISKADRVNTLRKQMAISSPSDNITSPCTLKLNRPKEFFRSKLSPLMMAGDADDTGTADDMEDAEAPGVDSVADDGADNGEPDVDVVGEGQGDQKDCDVMDQ